MFCLCLVNVKLYVFNGFFRLVVYGNKHLFFTRKLTTLLIMCALKACEPADLMLVCLNWRAISF